MSEMDDLEEIAAAGAFGFGRLSNYGASKLRQKQAHETCGHGHPWTDETTRWYKDARGRTRRTCRICNKARERDRRAKKRQASGSDAGRINPA